MHETHVCLTFDPSDDLFGTDSSPQAISAAARTATTAALKEVAGSATLMEPVMSVTISVPEESMGSVIHDISSARGGHILSLDGDADAEGETAKNETEQARLALPPIDLKRVWAPKDSYGAAPSATPSSQGQANVRQIKAQVPLKEMVGYLKHLRSLTSGRGTFVMSVDRFHRMSGQRVKALLAEWNEA
ncbi:Ribosome-releasing factor 2, mitochondrial [Ascosphaera acerosa]|nr:Ribosome-releasing factor 2, mitochondrial [Ascosphaera acerosa]